MKKIILMLTIILFPLFVFCKRSNKYSKAYVITTSNDTIWGQTKSSYSEQFNIQEIKFIYTNEFKVIFTGNSPIKQLVIGDKKFEKVELLNMPCVECPTKVFMKRVIDGDMIIYIYKFKKFTASPRISLPYINLNVCNIYLYYIKKKQDNIAAMAYRESCDTEIINLMSKPISDKEFIEYFSDKPEIYEKLKNGEYERKDIKNIINEYNDILKN